MSVNKKSNSSRNLKIFLLVSTFFLILAAYFGFQFYQTYFAPNISGKEKYLYVRSHASYEDFLKELQENGALRNFERFQKAALQMELADRLRPGRYLLTEGLNNRTLINKIKSGNQEAVSLKIQNFRKKENLAAYLAKNLEADSVDFMSVIDSVPLLDSMGYTRENIYTLFIPNTYHIYWNTSPIDFFNRMKKEHDQFWTAERKEKAAALKLNPTEATILASIVDAEALFDREMPTIAGLYLNRLERGIRLQADPTVIYANGDFTVKRVINSLLKKDSKYNTYLYGGLPPGPIMMPSIQAIDAVLNREKNNYIYMCAKEDFSGYHNFAETQAQHEVNAKKYREALNKRNIYR